MAAALRSVRSEDELRAALEGQRGVLLFYATWQDASRPGGQLQQLLAALAATPAHADTRFLVCEAEAAPALALHYQVELVPHFVLFSAPGQVREAFSGAEAPAVVQAVERLRTAAPEDPAAGAAAGNAEEAALRQRLQRLVVAAPVMLFMKGSPQAPRCKFSRRMVELLQAERVAFGSFDIFSDEGVRQGLKKFSDWPTYPQLYCRGELLGGMDVVAELAQVPGGLVAQLALGDEGAAAAAAAGTSAPDPAAGDAGTDAAATQEALEERLRQLVSGSPAMLFMKGTPDAPQCGFSRRIVEILRGDGWDFGFFDILQDNEVRQGLKAFSDWPTYPQLYVKGELMGGLDLVEDMKDSGDLADLKP